jgi:diguanylate cyclase (GGDEF)-like protein
MKLRTSDWRAVCSGLLGLAVALCVLGMVLQGAAERLLERAAEHSALAWAQFVGATVDDIDQVFAAQGPSVQGETDLQHVRRVQEIFRFALFDLHGRAVLTSEDLDPAGNPANSSAAPVRQLPGDVLDAVRAGGNVIQLRRSRRPDLPAVYCDAYVPVNLDGRLLGYVEVSVDQVERERRVHSAFATVSLSVVGLLLCASGLVGWRWFRRLEAERAAEDRVRYLARHDVLSDTLNRASFGEALEKAVARHEARGPGFAVLRIDLDHFKEVNDTLGHAAGDEVLRNVGARLREIVRHGDSVARLGSDEFAILQNGVSSATDVRMLAERVVEALSRPHEVNGRRVLGSGSVGAAIFEIDATEADELMHKADLALFRAKAAGRRTLSFYDSALDEKLEARRRTTRDLRDAIGTPQMALHYQPLYADDGQTLQGYEALLRWNHPTRGPVPPTEFIPVAEDNGLIDALGEWVLHTACVEAARWPAQLTVAVNLSAAQFRTGGLAGRVSGTLQSSGLPAGRLELEITESLLMGNTDAVMGELQGLSAIGVRIAMDDFGTGYSSLAYLWKFPFDKLKIDRAFTMHLGLDPKVDLIVKSIVTLAHSMGIRVNAEGVETAEQMAALRQLGCDQLQGFLLGRPAAAHALAHLAVRAPGADGAAPAWPRPVPLLQPYEPAGRRGLTCSRCPSASWRG